MHKMLGRFLLLVAFSGLGLADVSLRLQNAEQHFAAVFDRDGVTIDHAAKRLTMSLEGWGAVREVGRRARRVELQRDGLVEWYENSAKGLEQGFTVMEKVGPLELRLRVTGDYVAGADLDGLVLRPVGGSGRPLRYGELTAWDADGKVLESRMEARDGEIRLYVNDAGARYPVTIDPIVNEPSLPVSNLVANGNFGKSIAVSGDTALVGAPAQDSGDGAVYVYVRIGGTWVQQQEIKPLAGTNGRFGRSVAISGDLAIIGAPFEGDSSGVAYIYLRNGSWMQQARLTLSTGAYQSIFGWSVAIDGTTVIVGAPKLAPLFGPGAAYIFDLNRSGTWGLQAAVTLATSNDDLGEYVSISGNYAAVTGAEAAVLGIRAGGTWQWWLSPIDHGDPAPVSVNSKFAAVWSPTNGNVYVYQASGAGWKQADQVKAPSAISAVRGSGHWTAVAQIGDLVVVGAHPQGPGHAYAFRWNGSASPFVELQHDPTLDFAFGSTVAAGGNHILVGSPDANGSRGAVNSYRLENVTIQSNPPGQPFRLSGSGCGGDVPQILSGGFLIAPFTGYFTDCSVSWAPGLQPAPAGTRYAFQNWADGALQNLRQIIGPQDPTAATVSYTGNMLTEYQLTTQSIPASGGTLNGGGWFQAGLSAPLVAVPNVGFHFAGYTGDVKAMNNPFAIKMDGPKAVTANFATVPPASLAAMILPPTGPPTARNWMISVLNEGPGIAQETYLFLLGMRQTAGAPCVAMPVRLSPVMMPAYVGQIPVRGVANVPVTLDFSGCPADAQFLVNLGFAANGGSSGGIVRVMNQAR